MKHSNKCIINGILLIYFICISVKLWGQNDSIPREVSGVLISKSGNLVKISLDKNYAITPFLETRGELMKSFATESPEGTVTGWLSLAKMKVTAVSGNTIEMILIKDTRLGPGEDAKKDRFVSGLQVKFLWNEFATEDEVLYNKAMQQLSAAAILAEFNLKRVIRMNPKHSEALNLLGTIKEDQKVYDSAYYYYNRAFTIDSNNIKYLKNCSMTLIHLEQYNHAYTLAVKGVNSVPNDAYFYYLRAFSYLYIHKTTLNETDKSIVIKDMTQSITLDPNNPFYIKERAYVRSIISDLDGACEDAKKYAAMGGDKADDYIKRYCSQ